MKCENVGETNRAQRKSHASCKADGVPISFEPGQRLVELRDRWVQDAWRDTAENPGSRLLHLAAKVNGFGEATTQAHPDLGGPTREYISKRRRYLSEQPAADDMGFAPGPEAVMAAGTSRRVLACGPVMLTPTGRQAEFRPPSKLTDELQGPVRAFVPAMRGSGIATRAVLRRSTTGGRGGGGRRVSHGVKPIGAPQEGGGVSLELELVETGRCPGRPRAQHG
jgi:hypothetical protein